jgi:sugar lactone lactonase YvrE/enterochelin esterase-like enzyme
MTTSRFARLAINVCAALLLAAAPLAAQEKYPLGPDSQRQAGVPQGKVTKHTWTSQIFPGTVRDYWVYVPAQYTAATPAALMVFQDGAGYVNEEGRYRTPVVFDNLIHKREMPVTIGIFISPGVLPGPEGRPARTNRSFEYDALGDRYARFLLDEILPEVGKQYNLTSDPNLRAISGQSSGGICAFTVAWNRPDAFRRVLSFIGSFTNLRGGEIYSSLIRKTEPKPLRVFLQDGSNDLNNFAGNWWIANQDMASALEFAGYDFQFAKGDEAHNNIHGSSILPDALRWLWRGHGTPIAKPVSGERHWSANFVDLREDWELVSEGYRFTEGPAIDKAGNVFFTDIPNNRIHKIAPDGKVSVFKEDTGGANGLMFGADGRLYACQNGRKRIVAYAPDGAEAVIADDVNSNDLVVTHKGDIYFTDPGNQQVWHIGAGGNKSVAHKGIERPNGIILSPDQTMLMVNDSRGKWVWSFQIQADGSLAHGQPFYRLETPDESSVSGADGMTMASDGHLLVTSRAGLQICDLQGRVAAILNKPHSGSLANAVFAGPDLQTLYVTAGDKVLRRKMRLKGVLPWEAVKPAAARP